MAQIRWLGLPMSGDPIRDLRGPLATFRPGFWGGGITNLTD